MSGLKTSIVKIASRRLRTPQAAPSLPPPAAALPPKKELSKKQVETLQRLRSPPKSSGPPSPNISDQQEEGTCFAHSATRVMLRAIKQTLPTYFYPIDRDYCNKVLCKSVFENLTAYITAHNCGEKSTNNLLMFAYLYKVVTAKFGCNGAPLIATLQWLVEYIKSGFFGLSALAIMKDTLSDEHIDRTKAICDAFQNKFYNEQQNGFVVRRGQFSKVVNTRETFQTLKDVLDKGFYVLVYGVYKKDGKMTGHVVTMVEYEHTEGTEYPGVFIVKNSWNEYTCVKDALLGVKCVRGVMKVTFDDLLDGDKDLQYAYVYPETWGARDMQETKTPYVAHELKLSHVKKTLLRRGGNKRTAQQQPRTRRRTHVRKRARKT